MIRNLMIGAAAAAVFSGSALAADLPVQEPAPVATVAFSWEGFYVGAQAGYSWGRNTVSEIPLIGSQKFKPKGGVFGAFAGYNVQFDNSPLVIGVETDFNYADIDDSKNLLNVFGLVTADGKVKTRWTGATRARVGVAIDRALVWGAAGVAYERRRVEGTIGILGVGITAKQTKTAVGWTVGGGVDYAVTDNIFVRAEYRYTDFGKKKYNLDFGIADIDVKSKNREHRLMAGVAYKF